MKTNSKVRFKEVTSQQAILFPSNLSDRIRPNHPVRLVSQIVDRLNLDPVLSSYKGGGTSSYHPRIMVKILFYSYFCNIYSSRKIARLLEENIHFMWLSGNNTPDFRTINDFRGKRLKGHIDNLFAEMIRLLNELGCVSLDVQYVDGTKIEAVSNKYTFVWKGSVEKNKTKLEEKIQSVLQEIDTAIKHDQQAGDTAEVSSNITSDQLQEKIAQINARLDLLNKKQQKQVKQLEEENLPRLKRYEKQLETLGERNSYSKTDPDATFFRMKDDHMKNGQLKPAYNLQISTENQYITNFSLHQRAGDTATLIPHLEQFEAYFKKQSKTIVADSGYGSEQNYEYAKEHQLEAYIKYNYFHKEQKRKFKNDLFHAQNLYYNQAGDYLICPIGQRMNLIGKANRTSDLGYVSRVSIYQAANCNGCPMRGQCHKGKGNRRIEVNHKLNALRKQAREMLLSDEGKKHRSKRPIEPEAVFGQIKYDNKFNRLTLRGLRKVNTEIGLVVISHNLRKLAQSVSGNLKVKLLSTIFGEILTFLRLLVTLIFYKNQNNALKVVKSNFLIKSQNRSKLAA
jgi:transposase